MALKRIFSFLLCEISLQNLLYWLFSRFWRSKFTLKTFYIRTKLNYFFFIFLSIRLRYEGYWWDKIKFPMKLSQRSSKFSYFWANPVNVFVEIQNFYLNVRVWIWSLAIFFRTIFVVKLNSEHIIICFKIPGLE